METGRARGLEQKAQEVAERFSMQRGGNPGGEQFIVHEITVLGETTAAVVYAKTSGKKAVAFYYFVNSHLAPRWEYFFISYAHLTCLEKVREILFRIEQENYLVSVKPPTPSSHS